MCQKPWNCEKNVMSLFSDASDTPSKAKKKSKKKQEWEQNPLCMSLHYEWRKIRTEAEHFYGTKVIDKACPKGKP